MTSVKASKRESPSRLDNSSVVCTNIGMDPNKESWLVPRAEVFKALGHPARLLIAQTLRERPHSVAELVEIIGSDGSTVSKHLSILKVAGVIYGKKTGTKIYYRLACNCLAAMLDSVETVLRLKADVASNALTD